jgi:hypothetical protein
MRVPLNNFKAPKISGRQINLLVALGIKRGLRGIKLLEFIEYECGVNVVSLEEIRTDKFQDIVDKLEG